MDLLQLNFAAFKTPQEVFGEAARIARDRGFTYLLYGVIRQTVNGAQETVLSNYPDGWLPYYFEQGYKECDPVLKHMMTSNCHAIWTPRFFDANFKSRLMYLEAMEVGVKEGVTIPIHGGDGSVACVNFSSARIDGGITAATLGELYIIANFMHDAINALCRTSQGKEVRLTARELEAMKWATQGLTTAEVADKLLIGTRTAQEYLDNAVAKLGAVNRIHAVAKAISLKLV